MSNKLQPQKEVTVDGQKYIVQLYSPDFGLTLYAKLLRLLGQPIVKLIGMVKGANLDNLADFDLNELDTDAAGEALQSLFSNLKDEEFVPLIKEILSETYTHPGLELVNGDEFNRLFSGKYLHLFKLTAQTLGVQYADFLSGIVKRAPVAKIALASERKTKTTN